MRATFGNQDLPAADAHRSARLGPVMRRWRQAFVDVRNSLLFGDRRQTVHARWRARGPADRVAYVRPAAITAEAPAGAAGTAREQPVPLPADRSHALAILCDRLLSELDGAAVTAAEIRFVVHKPEHPGYPRLDTESERTAGDGELLWELRRLIAWSGGTIADVAWALEARGAELDPTARRLLQDELEAVEVDLATAGLYLADPIDWDSEFGSLLDGEVAPLDDLPDAEDDENIG